MGFDCAAGSWELEGKRSMRRGELLGGERGVLGEERGVLGGERGVLRGERGMLRGERDMLGGERGALGVDGAEKLPMTPVAFSEFVYGF